MQRFNIQDAPQMPQTKELRADPTTRGGRGPVPHIQASPVGATGDGLIRSTLKAGAAAIAILVFFVLPGEYGIDPTRVGWLLGLTELGEIKQQLSGEAAADAAKAGATASGGTATASLDATSGARLEAIERQLSNISAALRISPPVETAAATASHSLTGLPVPVPDAASPATAAAAPAASVAEAPSGAAAPAAPAGWSDTASVTLPPGEGVELKLAMTEGQTAQFEWTANGAVLNHGTHGDGGGQKISYAQGRGVPGETGELTAAFTGNHGWFWRNRSDEPVTLSLRVGGECSRLIQP